MVAVVRAKKDIWNIIDECAIVFGELLTRVSENEGTVNAYDIDPAQMSDYLLDFVRALLASRVRVKPVDSNSFPHMELHYENRVVYAEFLVGPGINIRFKEL
jgi:hypothetical protein